MRGRLRQDAICPGHRVKICGILLYRFASQLGSEVVFGMVVIVGNEDEWRVLDSEDMDSEVWVMSCILRWAIDYFWGRFFGV